MEKERQKEEGRGLELRPYQRKLVEEVRAAFARTSRVLAVLPTGGGKTVVAAEIVRAATEKGRRILAVAHRRELVGQLRETFARALGLSPQEVPAYLPGERVPENAPLAVGSLQTLARRGVEGRWDLVVVDEAHHVPAESYQDVVRAGRWVLGLTATPVRVDGKGLGDHFGALVQGPTVGELIEAGYLVPPRYLVPEGGWDVSRLSVVRGDYSPREVEALAREVRLEAQVVETYLEHLRGRPTIVFAAGVEHGRELAARFRKAGVRAAFLEGETPPEKREGVLQAFREGDLEVLVNVALFTEGYDEARISGVLLARPTRSLGLYLQMVGRALRPHPGKEDTLVADVTGANFRAFGPVEGYTRWTLTRGRVEPERVRASSPPRPSGEKREVRVLEGAGRLKEVSPEDLEERKRFYLGLRWYARQRGYREGWAYYRYLERFKEKPLWVWREEEPVFHEEAYAWARAGRSRPAEALLLEAE